MFSTLRNRFGIPGVISVIALVFALVGGAFAANNLGGPGKGATASAKKSLKGPRGPRGPKGATGAAGPAGPAGAPGAKGDAGTAGANGANGDKGAAGKDGQSVKTAVEPPFGECGEQEGVELTSATGTSYVCNGAPGAKGSQGEKGSPWTAGGTLPAKSTQTGAWSITADPDEAENLFGAVGTTISFGIPLATSLNESQVHYVKSLPAPSGCEDPDHAGLASVGNPEASSGHLCVYEGLRQGPVGLSEPLIGTLDFEGLGASTAGAALLFAGDDKGTTPPTLTAPILYMGSFAVTG